MKPIKLFFFVALFSATASLGQNITLSLENAQIVTEGMDDFYVVDVFISSDSDYTQGSGQYLFNYNTAAFGPDILMNGNIEYIRPLNSILGSQTFGVDNYNQFFTNDNTISRTSILWQQFWSAGTIGTNITSTPVLLIQMKIRFLNSALSPDVCFDTTPPFNEQFFTACGPFTPAPAGADCIAAPGTQIPDYTPDCSGGIIACTDMATWTAGGWDISPMVPTSSTSVMILADYNTSTVGASIDACQLTIDSNATLTIAQGDYLQVDGDITVETGASLIVAHTANVVQVDDAAVVTNNGTINVNVTTPTLNPRDFMVMGSPMTSETREDVFTNAFRVLNHTTANFVPHPDVTMQFPLAENFADDNGDDWTTHTGLLNPAEGYLVWPFDLQTGGSASYTFDQGTLNNGVVTYNVGYNGTKNANHNVLANPYASAISATDFINANAMIDEVYFWEHLTTPNNTFPGYNSANFSMEDISMRNLMGGVAAASDPGTSTQPNDFISTGQGFAIKASETGTAAVFNNSMRRITGNNTLRNPLEADRIWLQIRNDQYELQSSTLIGFSENTSEAIDQGYDSRRLATVVSLYSHLNDGSEELGIQAREAFESTIKIPMGFSTLIDANESYRISIADLEGANLENATVYLIDNDIQTITNLSETDYEFTSEQGTFNNRFTLQFVPENILGTPTSSLESIAMYPNPTNGILYIESQNNVIDQIVVYDIRGRIIMSKRPSSEEEYFIDFSVYESAIYLVKIKSRDGDIVKRVVKE